MMGRTHALAGISSLWVLSFLPPESININIGVLAACAAFGALLPDLDAVESKIKRLEIGGVKPFFLLAQSLHKEFGHRGFMHSLMGLGVFALLVSPVMLWSGWLIWAALLLGYGTHLVGDLCTTRGIPLLYPKQQRYCLLPFRLVTGSLAEEVIFVLLALTTLLLLLQYLPLYGGSSF